MTAPRLGSLRQVLGRFRRGGELRPLVCLAASLGAALLLGGAAVCAAWAVGMTRPDRTLSGVRGDVRRGDVVTALWVAGGAWLLALVWIWRPAVRRLRHSLAASEARRGPGPLAACAAVVGALTVASFFVGTRPWDDREYAVTGLSLVAAGALVALWLPALARLDGRRAVQGPGGRVNVHCPECGYSMVGLRETTCPECGRGYTIDELIREQGYEDPA